ncbi:hypothetical protein NBO_276g0002 [Nosema bombycis CQ1]|uniref:Uncharacterized protein n=1 Tax=Nosema bombycis (strain CQ1 / CVCC 102059) TaxID=578461 RepID=R0KS04_NOSB1|nr:hypothetical protein NBO_276g0002 [Nosema bombycis CQ1]|eukprot:EOB12987.1 hypothetical protein NBO_276g0002 [Nosema bombycis CQ1]
MLDIFSIVSILHEIYASTENITVESTTLLVKADIHKYNSEHNDVGLLQDQSSEDDNKKINKSQHNVIINIDNIDRINETESISLEPLKKQDVPQFTNLDEDLDKKSEENKALNKNLFIKFKECYFDALPEGTLRVICILSLLGAIACGVTIFCYKKKDLWFIPLLILLLCIGGIIGSIIEITRKFKEANK